MTGDTDQVDAIEACRTCGIYYMSTTNYLKPIFQSAVDYPEMMLIRLELSQWKLEITENDGLPQYVCSSCIHEFQKVFKFRSACTETQDQLRTFYNMREENLANIKIKTEITDPEDVPECNFIYVDDLSDGEYDSITPFNIPHIPIKEELIEEATVPRENGIEAVCIAESASEVGKSRVPPPPTFNQSFVEQPESAALTTELAPPPVECELCQHLSPDQEEHKQHLRRVHEIRDMECHICGKVFKNSTPSRYKFHLKWHNINKHVKCPQCGFVCNSRLALKEHRRAVHAKISCKICGKGIIARKMKSHLREHEVLTKFPCEYCTETFQSEDEREEHIWKIHADESQESFGENQQHTNHEESNVVSEEMVHVELICAHCDQKFAKQTDLVMHVKQEHRQPTQQPPLITDYASSIDDHHIESEPMGTHHSVHETIEDDHHEDGGETVITVFQDYDDDDDEQSNLPQDNTIDMSNSLPKDNNSIHYQHFAEYPSNATNNTLDEDDDEVIENFRQQQQSTMNDDIMATSSAHDSGSNSNTSLVAEPELILPFACAKCTDTFATIEQLRVHHQQHQAQMEKSPNKSKFICNICGKKFDLKFSLNRHMKKHNTSL